VDLIYLDPPFNSRQDYNVLFAERRACPERSRRGTRSASQIMAFEDTWEWNLDAEAAVLVPGRKAGSSLLRRSRSRSASLGMTDSLEGVVRVIRNREGHEFHSCRMRPGWTCGF
jgi:hypothetical protein